MLLDDLRYSLRQFRMSPGFVLTAILLLTLGIGANTAIFSVVAGVLLHPSGVDHPERLAVLNTRYTKLGAIFPESSIPDFADAASLTDTVEAAAIEQDASFNAFHNGVAQHFNGAQVSPDWFRIFGAQPVLGRAFTNAETLPGANRVAMLSYSAWQDLFGGAADAVGKTLVLDRQPLQVVGVLRGDFDWPRGAAIFTPIPVPPAAFAAANRFNENYTAVLRLRPGVTTARLNSRLAIKQLETIRQAGSNGYAASSGWGMFATPLTEFAAGPLRKPLLVLFGVVALVLLIASANVAGLLLARSSARAREFALRTALGASPARIAQQLLTETLLLAAVATAFGIAVGPDIGRAVLWLVPQNLAQGYEVHLDSTVLFFTAIAGLLTSLIAGVGPALRAVGPQRRMTLHDSGRSNTASASQQRLRTAFVVIQVALAFVLLSTAGLFLASLRELQHIDPGFDPNHVFSGQVYFSGDAYRGNQTRQSAFVNSVLQNLSAQPGIQAVAAIEPIPFNGQSEANTFEIQGQSPDPHDTYPHSGISFTTAGYLNVMHIPLITGRWFTDADRAGSELVVVIDQKLAHRFWPNRTPLGQHLRDDSDDKNPKWARIIGVVGSVRRDSLEEDSGEGMRYYPTAQSTNSSISFAFRSDADPLTLGPSLARSIAAADPFQTAFGLDTLQARVNSSLSARRLIVSMLAAFAGLALLLALVGIYGLISFLTLQRKNEMGLRMALGAQRSEIVHLVLKGALARVGFGLCLGVAFSIVATLLLNRVFVSFGAGAVPSLSIAAFVMLVVGSIAALIPARRAASVDPMQALRNE